MVEGRFAINQPKIKCRQVESLSHLPPRKFIRTHKCTQVAMIGEYFHSMIQLLELGMSMTESLNNGKKFIIVYLVVSLDVDHFA